MKWDLYSVKKNGDWVWDWPWELWIGIVSVKKIMVGDCDSGFGIWTEIGD